MFLFKFWDYSCDISQDSFSIEHPWTFACFFFSSDNILLHQMIFLLVKRMPELKKSTKKQLFLIISLLCWILSVQSYITLIFVLSLKVILSKYMIRFIDAAAKGRVTTTPGNPWKLLGCNLTKTTGNRSYKCVLPDFII